MRAALRDNMGALKRGRMEERAPEPILKTEGRPRCRFCAAPLEHIFAELGMTPLANAFLRADQLNRMEPFYPLRAYVCGQCFLAQLEAFETPGHIFGDYAYFSSYAESWLRHAEAYTDAMIARFSIDGGKLVVEVASNDGYLLQYFKQRGVPVLGIEPAANVARVAVQKGIPTEVLFLGGRTGQALAAQGSQGDLVVGNNVLAHVPDINDFVIGLREILKPAGVLTMEFPHLLNLIEQGQFDTIYHEHFSYLSLYTVERIFRHHGLTVFDVEELPTHGGSLRIYARHEANARHAVEKRVAVLLAREAQGGLQCIETYTHFAASIRKVKLELLDFLVRASFEGKAVAGYGAPAKGNTLLNYCGIRTDLLAYTVDRSPHKQGLYLPGTHIPVYDPERLRETRPDYVLILPWNLREEIAQQLRYVRDWGCRLVVAIPQLEVLA
jgi:SAM-dependent methyltransferase